MDGDIRALDGEDSREQERGKEDERGRHDFNLFKNNKREEMQLGQEKSGSGEKGDISPRSLTLPDEEEKMRMEVASQRSSRTNALNIFKRNRMNFEIYDDIFELEQSRINKHFHQVEHEHY